MTRPAREKRPPGIRKTPQGWQAYVWIHGHQRSKRFPPATGLQAMKLWREEQKVRAHLGATLPAAGITLRAAVRDYLAQVQTMPTLSGRTADLRLWMDALGPDTPLDGITSGMIRAQLEKWRKAGYAANTCNNRRVALMSLFSTLRGKSSPNPARDVARYRDDSQDAPPRILSATASALIFACMPTSQTKARLELFRWTGWPAATMGRLTPEDVKWDEAVRLRPRRKGKGAAGVWLPLLPQAWTALRDFQRLDCWGPYSTSSAYKSFRLGARKARRVVATHYARRTMDRGDCRRLRVELLRAYPYELRHSFASLIASITTDDRAVQTLLQHSDLRTTHRYTRTTADPRAAAALLMVSEALK